MKRLLFLIAFLLMAAAPSAARANWSYVEYTPGWYLRTNGIGNDGNIYYRVQSYYNGCYACAGSYYALWGPVTASVGYQATTAPQYTIPEENFDVSLVNALNAEKERQHRERALAQSGLLANANGSYSPASYGGVAYGSSGTYFNTLTQGFNPTQYNPQGSSIWGLAALPSVHYEDSGPEIHEFQQTVRELKTEATQTVNNLGGLVDHHASVIAGNNAALTAELMRNNRILALGIASQTSSTQTQAGTFAPVYPAGPQPQQQAGPPAGPPQNVPAQPQPPATAPQAPAQAEADTPDLRQAYLDAGWARLQQTCLKCHGGDATIKPGGGADFTALDSMSDKDRSDLANEAWHRMRLPVTDPKHMPRSANGQPAVMLADDVVNNIATKILGKTGPAQTAAKK